MRYFVPTAVLLMAAGPVAADEVDYLKQVKPLLAARCASCHGALAQKARLRLDTATLVRKGGRNGVAVVPGKSAESLLIHAVVGDGRTRMPPESEGAPLSGEQVVLLKKWIDQGAKGPENEPIPEDTRKHWAFQKPARTADPSTANPIDAFINREHAKHNLHPRPSADRATLLRRVTIDLTGLPPTREQLHDFLADTSPDAYEKVVDRLLASRQYGERWARHWMDVWRYSDWYGRRQEKDWRNSSPTLWRWRDWIVRSLNEDRGYDRMVQEMLAADEIAPEDDTAQAATGFLARNYYSLNHDTWMKDQVEHTAKAFLGLTLNCCHCHDHKYDPITQEEYFRFRAFFEPIGLRQDRVPGEPDPGPYVKYGYGASGKVITSGLVRVMDDRLDAKTQMYRLGNERDYFPDRPAVTPGAPAVVGGDRLTITPVELPPAAVYPGLKSFIQQEELARAESGLATARAAKPVDPLQVTEAEARLKALRAVIAADRAKFKLGPGDPVELARSATKAQAFHDLSRAHRQRYLAEQSLLVALKTTPDANAVRKAEQALAAAQDQVAKASQRYEQPTTAYTPLTPSYPAKSTGRRAALARWIGSTDNPLTARVAVNHIWTRHFGVPLVESVFDFGRNGKTPTHPELLDWLAVEFMESKWSMKSIHRLIVTSRTYQLHSSPGRDDNNLARDPDNHWLWRYPSRRVEAEVIRDGLLFVAGDLDMTLGGKEVETTQEPTSTRRSLYFSIHPEVGGALKLLEFFDAPDTCDCYRRTDNLVPQQALALTNSDFAHQRSRSLARRLLGNAGVDATITTAFEQVLTRAPTAEETATCREFIQKQIATLGKSVAPDVARQRAWESLVRVLFNHHEFVTLR